MKTVLLFLALAPHLWSQHAGSSQLSTEVAATGTGFLISSQGHILTNSHVVAGCSDVQAVAGSSTLPAAIVASDQQNDLALLKTAPWEHPALSFRADHRLRLGESVAILGYPLQRLVSTSITLTSGNISALAGLGNDVRVLQFTAPIQPGNSGGPVLDASGLVIGMVFAKLSASGMAKATGDLPQNVNWALKASIIKDFLDTKEIRYNVETGRPPVDLTALGDTAKGAIVRVHCMQSGPISSITSPRVPNPRQRRLAQDTIREAKTLAVLANENPPLKAETTKELLKWGRFRLLSDPREADLVLKIVRPRQDGLFCTDPGAAILHDSIGGEDLWSTTKMGTWRCGDSSVGRAIAKDLIKYIEGILKTKPR